MTFTDVHMGRKKVPISDFQSPFSMSKNVRIFLKNIFIEEYQFRTTFFDNFKIEDFLFLKLGLPKMTSNFWRHSAISSIKMSKKHFVKFDFFLKRLLKRFRRFLTLNVQISWFSTPLCHLSITDIKKPFCNIWFFLYKWSLRQLCGSQRH